MVDFDQAMQSLSRQKLSRGRLKHSGRLSAAADWNCSNTPASVADAYSASLTRQIVPVRHFVINNAPAVDIKSE